MDQPLVIQYLPYMTDLDLLIFTHEPENYFHVHFLLAGALCAGPYQEGRSRSHSSLWQPCNLPIFKQQQFGYC